MAILDLIRNYGNRQVVREKDKAIIELAKNGGGNNIDTKMLFSLTNAVDSDSNDVPIASFGFFNSKFLIDSINLPSPANMQFLSKFEKTDITVIDYIDSYDLGFMIDGSVDLKTVVESLLSNGGTIKNHTDKTNDELLSNIDNGNYLFLIAFSLIRKEVIFYYYLIK